MPAPCMHERDGTAGPQQNVRQWLLGDGAACTLACWYFLALWTLVHHTRVRYNSELWPSFLDSLEDNGVAAQYLEPSIRAYNMQAFWYLASTFKRHPGGDPSCWDGIQHYLSCCQGTQTTEAGLHTAFFHPPGNPHCWDATYTYERCCLQGQKLDLDPQVFHPVAMESLPAFDWDHRPVDRPRYSEMCAPGFESYLAVGEVRTRRVPFESLKRLLFPYEPAQTDSAVTYSALDYAVSNLVHHQEKARVHFVVADFVGVMPNLEAMHWKTWYCLRNDQSYDKFLGVLRKIYSDVWRVSTTEIAKRMQERMLDKLNSSIVSASTPPEVMSRVLGAAWALESAAEEGGLHIDAFSKDELDPVCVCGDKRWECRWERLPSWAVLAMGLALVPGMLYLHQSLSALVSAGQKDVDSLSIWRLIMTLLVINHHLHDHLDLPLSPLFPRLDFLGNTIAFALSIHLQGEPVEFSGRLSRRWARQLPTRLLNVMLDLYVVRGLLTRDFDANALIPIGNSANSRRVQSMSLLWQRLLQSYRQSWMGLMAEILEPISNWTSFVRSDLQGPNLWFFRTEATLWLLVMLCRCSGFVGCVILGGIFLAFMSWFHFVLYRCLFTCGVEGLLDVGAGTCGKWPAFLLVPIRILSRLTFPICLLHKHYVVDLLPLCSHGRDEGVTLCSVIWISVLLSAFWWVAVQFPSEQMCLRLLSRFSEAGES
eukprot:TRINITY_DN35370_c0_g1_i3.p1 TRINITY_DN35370_c0_g1~~TRINITY_DN35370_c0_g1_i3.p1  ORF type:complete len:707 (+),score=65.29 TRINITY_DN35370_c0_g1_i3:196-2316(+)